MGTILTTVTAVNQGGYKPFSVSVGDNLTGNQQDQDRTADLGLNSFHHVSSGRFSFFSSGENTDWFKKGTEPLPSLCSECFRDGQKWILITKQDL